MHAGMHMSLKGSSMGMLARLCGLGLMAAGIIAASAYAATSQETGTQENQQAQPKQNQAQQPKEAWATNCSAPARSQPLDCAMEQRAIASETGQAIAQVTIRVPQDTKKPVTMIQVPHGLFLPAGLSVDVDGDLSQNFPFQTCNANGCFVGFPIPDQMLKAMFNGNKFNVTFQNLAKKPVILPMSLAGFTGAYNRIK